MTVEITIPNFDFSGFYYPEILEALIEYKREYVPEHTEESEYDPFMQLLRAFALVSHQNNVLLDLIANNSTLPTSELPEVVRNMLKLIDYRMTAFTPSQVDVIYELSKVLAISTEIISARTKLATKKELSEDIIPFEALTALTVTKTDEFTYVLGEEAGVFTDHTTNANSQTTPANDWSPWVSAEIKDSIYFGHSEVMWNQLDLYFTTVGQYFTGVWEFYDGDWYKTVPTSVSNLGGTLEIDITGLLGTNNRQGTMVRVRLNSTTAYEEVESTWDGSKNVLITTGLLGQSSPSLTVTDYAIGSDWSIISGVEDGTINLTQDGIVEFTLPQDLEQDWILGDVDGKSAFWLRYRVVTVSGPTNPTLQYGRMDLGKQYAKRAVTQGVSAVDEILGSSNGLISQEFKTSQKYFIWGSETVTIDSEVWTRVDNFLNSLDSDKHYVVELVEDDVATIITGGNNGKGKIAPVGISNVVCSYRHGAQDNGNVGASSVVVDKSGLTYVNKFWNPRQANGWIESQSASEEGLERAKVEGPATVRIKDVAIGPDDVVEHTIAFEDSDGTKPFTRAQAFEEGFGPKTMEIVAVVAGGGTASSAQLEALEEYFNGNKFASPPVRKHLVANQEVGAANFTQKVIDVTATVYGNTTEAAVKAQLARFIQPEAKEKDGATYIWDFDGEVQKARINNIIFETDPSMTDVQLSVPSSNVDLQKRELPVIGTMAITVIVPT